MIAGLATLFLALVVQAAPTQSNTTSATNATNETSATSVTSPTSATNPTYDVTKVTPKTIVDPAPIALALEFSEIFQLATNFTNVPQCIKNLDNASGQLTKIRIGGSSADKSFYVPEQTTPLECAGVLNRPINCTFGPSLFPMIDNFIDGPVTFGLDRCQNQLNNSIEAAKEAVRVLGSKLYTFEMGNEPGGANYKPGAPIRLNKSWGIVEDAESEAYWQSHLGAELGMTSFISAGVYTWDSKWDFANLTLAEQNAGTLDLVKTYSQHNYITHGSIVGDKEVTMPNTTVRTLMYHPNTVANVAQFATNVRQTYEAGKIPIMGETNSITGPGPHLGPTFGDALWVIDYAFQGILLGYQTMHFQNGGCLTCLDSYNFWQQTRVENPYYGAYFSSLAFADVGSFAQLDAGNSALAVYALYDSSGSASKVVVINTNYYDGSTQRGNQSVTINGIGSITSATSHLLIAKSAISMVTKGETATFGGVSFDNTTCNAGGEMQGDTIPVQDGSLTISLPDSSAALVYLK